MARVKSRDTSAELRVRRMLHGMGIRFRLHRRDLPGRPDLVLPKYGMVVFVHGCFWHRHPGCKRATMPKTRVEFWRNKFERNAARDLRVACALGRLGWKVAVIWECETLSSEILEESVRRIFGFRRTAGA